MVAVGECGASHGAKIATKMKKAKRARPTRDLRFDQRAPRALATKCSDRALGRTAPESVMDAPCGDIVGGTIAISNVLSFLVSAWANAPDSRSTHPRIQQPIQEIDNENRHEHADGDQEKDRLHQRIVAVIDR